MCLAGRSKGSFLALATFAWRGAVLFGSLPARASLAWRGRSPRWVSPRLPTRAPLAWWVRNPLWGSSSAGTMCLAGRSKGSLVARASLAWWGAQSSLGLPEASNTGIIGLVGHGPLWDGSRAGIVCLAGHRPLWGLSSAGIIGLACHSPLPAGASLASLYGIRLGWCSSAGAALASLGVSLPPAGAIFASRVYSGWRTRRGVWCPAGVALALLGVFVFGSLPAGASLASRVSSSWRPCRGLWSLGIRAGGQSGGTCRTCRCGSPSRRGRTCTHQRPRTPPT
jgi:hypothetical protein